MVGTIARKEFIEMVRDGRFRWAGGIVLTLLLVSLAVGWKTSREIRAQHEAAQRTTRDQWLNQGAKNPHSAAHFGTYAFKPKPPLALVDPGMDSYLGVAAYLEAHFQNHFQFRPAEDATALHRFGELAAAAVLQLLVPLLIVVLTFSTFSGERENGTLRQLLSLGVSPGRMALGKFLGSAGALATFLLPATVLGVAVLTLTTGTVDPLRGVLMGVGYLLYFGAFLGLSLAVSALSATSRGALVVLLAFWIVNGLIVPRAAGDLAERVFPTPSYSQFWDAVAKDKQAGIDGHNPADRRAEELKRATLARYGVAKIEDLPVNFDGIRLQAGEEFTNQVYDKHFGRLWDIYARHERVQTISGIIAPFQAIRAWSMGMAGTDFAQHRDFSRAAERYRRELNKSLNDDLTINSKTGDFFYFADHHLWERMPDFSYRAPRAGWVLSNHVGSLGILAGWCLVSIGAAVISAARIRP